jgi:hypothetical protein
MQNVQGYVEVVYKVKFSTQLCVLINRRSPVSHLFGGTVILYMIATEFCQLSESRPISIDLLILIVPTNADFYYYVLHSQLAATRFSLTAIIMELTPYY